jgi:hypothetical protein
MIVVSEHESAEVESGGCCDDHGRSAIGRGNVQGGDAGRVAECCRRARSLGADAPELARTCDPDHA